MGLGKTVEGIGGIFVREILALHCGVPAQRRASLVVAPNVQVMEQWHEHLIKAGVSATEIGVYNGDRHRKHGILRACSGDGGEEGAHMKVHAWLSKPAPRQTLQDQLASCRSLLPPKQPRLLLRGPAFCPRQSSRRASHC